MQILHDRLSKLWNILYKFHPIDMKILWNTLVPLAILLTPGSRIYGGLDIQNHHISRMFYIED